MTAGSGSTLALAARLRALDEDALTRLVTARGVRDTGIRDVFDLAEALLDRASVQAALSRLDRRTLAALAVAGDLAGDGGSPTAQQVAGRLRADPDDVRTRLDEAVGVGLAAEEGGRYAPWDAVAEQLRAWPAFGLPSLEELVEVPPPPALEPVSEADIRFVDRGAGERAFGTVAQVAEILAALREAPARRVSRGGVALPDARRLADAAGADADTVHVLLDIAERAGLAAAGTSWRPTPAADDWLAAPRLERWRRLAAGWLDRLPDELHRLLRDRARAVWGDGLLDYLRWRYPAGGDWVRERITQVAREAELLGLAGSATPSTPGAALLLRGPDAAAEAMAALLPAEVDAVYLQPDLSVIAPGPLRPELEHRLRGLADIESRGVASSFRVTPASLTRALLAGETAEGIRGFLASISLTGIPQPLDYLIAETAARLGALRVGVVETATGPDAGARSYVRSDDATLLRQVEVDQALAPLGLVRADAHRLVSRFDAELVAATLAEARYPVAREDAAGRLLPPRGPSRPEPGEPAGDDTATILVQRIREGSEGAPEETHRAWLARQLELAIKGRIPVAVRIRMPDGRESEAVLEPASLVGGRLRARDRRADIERTLPLGSIVSVEPLVRPGEEAPG